MNFEDKRKAYQYGCNLVMDWVKQFKQNVIEETIYVNHRYKAPAMYFGTTFWHMGASYTRYDLGQLETKP